MTTLVTGAAGFIGSHLCERLVELGHDVRGVDCFSDYYSVELKRLNAQELSGKGVAIADLDLAIDDFRKLLEGVAVVFHLAAQPGLAAHVPFETYLRNNVTATYRLLQACLGSPTIPFFVYISTSSVYGCHAASSETAAPQPTSYYGVTKLAAEQLALAYCREGKLPACSLRLFSVYGPRERPEKLYTKLISSILNDSEFPLYEGSEGHRRSYTFVGDAVEGISSVLGCLAECWGEIYNMGSDKEITTARGIEIVEGILGKKARKRILPPRPGDQLLTHANIDKARSVLGFEPKTTPEEGLRAQIDWYKSHMVELESI